MKHWHMTRDGQGLAWLTLDQDGAAVNTLSPDILDELDILLARLEATPPDGLVLRSAKPAGFIAGADVKGFVGLADPAAAQAIMRRAHTLLARLEALPCASVALIHGHCLGGGLELALARRYRLATDDAKTSLGFPEVRLGIFPGFGGTVRAPARIGHLAAVPVTARDRMLSFLPLSHMLERTVGYYLPMAAGCPVAYARSIPQLGDDLIAARPTLLIAVPRIFERMRERILKALGDAPPMKQRLFHRAVDLGWRRFLHRQGRAPWSPDCCCTACWALVDLGLSRPGAGTIRTGWIPVACKRCSPTRTPGPTTRP